MGEGGREVRTGGKEGNCESLPVLSGSAWLAIAATGSPEESRSELNSTAYLKSSPLERSLFLSRGFSLPRSPEALPSPNPSPETELGGAERGSSLTGDRRLPHRCPRSRRHSVQQLRRQFATVEGALITAQVKPLSLFGSSSLLVGDFFSLEHGLRQGCPLSPLLFNLVAESFSALFHHATVVGFITPHSLPHLQTFSTLQYADDFLLFGCASRQQIVRTWLILRVFELISGLSINSAKCHLSLIHADPATVLLAEACFGCKATSLPMDYLGLQITLSPPAPSFWNGVEQKLTDRLQCWQGKLLSLPGRITLAKHCFASVPLHALVVFRPPVAVLRRFDKLIRKFIWDGDRPSDRLAHWDVVAFPRLLGGAGVTNLSRASESSLCSWWWRLATERSPITQFISSKFDLPSPSVWNASISHTSPSHFWCDMLSVLPLFLRLADLSSSTSPSWPLSSTREFTFSSCYMASFGPSVASIPPRSLWSPGPSPRAIAFAWLLLTGHINTFDHLQRLGISLANQCPLCLVATESRVHLFTSCPFFSNVLDYVWPSLVSSLPNPPSIRLLFLFCPSPHLTASWGQVWRPWLISAWWRIWEERNNRVFRDTFSSPDSVARIVQGDVQFAIRLRRRCPSAAR
ncbi:reverse transcriptase-like protein [Nymphaea thermarum]|nr:reverse transcriptase-like protein [Nymphaea thermarum]